MPRTTIPVSAARLVFGHRLRLKRRAANLTLEDLAERTRMNPSYLAQVELGSLNIGIDGMAHIALALRTPLSELLLELPADLMLDLRKQRENRSQRRTKKPQTD